ncbi:hypothetical protein NDU88_002193, partial [Pleurodeles waltl]
NIAAALQQRIRFFRDAPSRFAASRLTSRSAEHAPVCCLSLRLFSNCAVITLAQLLPFQQQKAGSESRGARERPPRRQE